MRNSIDKAGGYMFKIIDAQNKSMHNQDLMEMFSKREQDALWLDDTAYDHKDSVYLLFNDSETGIYGSIRLNPMTTKNAVSDTLQQDISTYVQSCIWECSSVCFNTSGEELNQSEPEVFEHYCKYYYQALKGALSHACARFQIGMLLFMNTKNEIEDMEFFGGIAFSKTVMVDAEKELVLAMYSTPNLH